MEIELNKPYTHTKTGRPYTLITNNFMFKEPHRDSNGEVKYEWRRGLCLYKTEYDKDTIGLLFCKEKNDLVAQWTVEKSEQPIAITRYELEKLLPSKQQKKIEE